MVAERPMERNDEPRGDETSHGDPISEGSIVGTHAANQRVELNATGTKLLTMDG